MIDTVRGVLRVRRWPKKRVGKQTPQELFWVDWFRQANRLAKYVDAASAIRAIDLSKFSGFYPRDILLKAMRGRLYTWTDDSGWKWYSVAAIGDITESLDVLAQTVGSVLVRAVDRWRAPLMGVDGDILTLKGTPLVPEWQVPASAGGLSEEELDDSPISPDNTVNEYKIDVSAYAIINLSVAAVGFAASDALKIRFSTDGAVSFHSGGSDYFRMFLTSDIDGSDSQAQYGLSTGTAAANHNAQMKIANLNVGRAVMTGVMSSGVNVAQAMAGFVAFDGPITDIRIYAKNGNNLNAGKLHLTGIR